jgi:pimeloyl-ACP methyl ester carboxylesterase
MKLQHGRVAIELHLLKDGEGVPLLLLHALGGASADWSEEWRGWPGPVHALDFAGHGRSGHLRGGGYYPEYFLADADTALEEIGDRAAVAGAGVGAYVALLLAGARPERVPAALLLPGRGLECGGASPDFQAVPDGIEAWESRIASDSCRYAPGTDPLVSSCEHDIRPLDYVAEFAAAAPHLILSREVAAGETAPAWWRTALETSKGELAPIQLSEALEQLHRACR